MANFVQVRVTAEERYVLEQAAAATGESLSDYVRALLGLETFTKSEGLPPLDFRNDTEQ